MLWDFSIPKAAGIVARTWPFLLLRVAVYGLFAMVFLVMTVSGGIIGHQTLPLLFETIVPMQGGIFGAFGGMAFGGLVLRILREYSLYMVKAAHVAVMVRLFDHGALPAGASQLAYGWGQVRERFAEASVLFALDQLIKAALAGIGQTMQRLGGFMPGLRAVFGIVQAIADVAIGYVDEIVLAQNLRTKSTNPWKASADAVVLYAQNGGAMLRNAAWLTLILAVAGVAVFVVVAGPVALALGGLEGPVQMYGLIGSAVVTIFVLHVLLEPFAVCALMSVYFARIDGQTPDPRWEERLNRATPALAELRANGEDFGDGAVQPA
ncbi:MAG: hypothetical protein ABL307_00625 [Roseitalea porphyridii]|uniref:hypothetical protein n=1 Tax=Roseitalea porphyridii TaxID=1852022 RepID=UPI0032D96EED